MPIHPPKIYTGRGRGYPRPPTPTGDKTQFLMPGEALKLAKEVEKARKETASRLKASKKAAGKKAASSRKKKTAAVKKTDKD